jgi:transposase
VAGYHCSDKVADKARALGKALHYLPIYTPNLNPKERLWKVINEHARDNKYFCNGKVNQAKYQQFFDSVLPIIGATLNCRINDNFQKFYLAT